MMSTPIVLTVIIPVILIGSGLYLAYKARNRPMPKNVASVMIVVFSVVFSSLCGITGLVLYFNAQADYEDCVRAVTRSFGGRDYNVDTINIDQEYDQHLLEYLQSRGVNDEVIVAVQGLANDKANRKTESLLHNLPLRSLQECDALKPTQ